MDSLRGFSRLDGNAAVQTLGFCVQNYSAELCPITACPEASTQARHQIVTLTANCGRSTVVPFVPPDLAFLPPISYPFDSARYQWLAFPTIENQTDMGQKLIGPR